MTKRKKKEHERTHQMKTHSRSKQCGKKKAYNTQEEADGYATMYSDPRYCMVGDSTLLRAYFCPQCNKFHLTSQKKVNNKA